MTDKQIRVLGAGRVDAEDRRQGFKPGVVGVHVTLDWLKSQPVVTAELTASQALRFAEDLLASARRVLEEGK